MLQLTPHVTDLGSQADWCRQGQQHISCCHLQASITLPHWENCHTQEDRRELSTTADPATRRIRKLARTHLRTTLARQVVTTASWQQQLHALDYSFKITARDASCDRQRCFM